MNNYLIVFVFVFIIMMIFYQDEQRPTMVGGGQEAELESTDVVKYVGCYEDDSGRYLQGKEFQFINNTPNQCTAFCRTQGFKYAGLQGDLCFCDNRPKRGFGKKLDDNECNDPCPSDSSQKCGKNMRNRIYNTGIGGEFADKAKTADDSYISTDYISYGVPKSTSSCHCNRPEYIDNRQEEQGVAATSYMGCYNEMEDEHLSYNASPSGHSSLTPNKCQYMCRNQGYRYAGVRSGNECWCGNSEKLGELRPEWECNTPCTGDANQNCGGLLRQNVYQVK